MGDSNKLEIYARLREYFGQKFDWFYNNNNNNNKPVKHISIYKEYNKGKFFI